MHHIFGKTTEEERSLGISRRSFQDNIKMVHKKQWEGVDWIRLPQYRNQWRLLISL